MTRHSGSVFARLAGRVALAVGVLVAVSACTGGPTGYAFVYDGEAHSQVSVDKELTALAGNNVYLDEVRKASGEPIDPDGAADDTKLPARLTADWLNVLVQDANIDAAAAEADFAVTDADRAAAEQQAIQFFRGEESWNDFPKWFRDRVTARQATNFAFLRSSLTPTEADLLEYFDENLSSLCESGLIVAHILVADADAAQDIVDELDDGGDFAALAVERGTDGSAAGGGGLGCLVAGQFVPEFESPALALEPGTHSGVVETQFGFHVIRAETATYESLREEIATAIANEFSTEIGERLKAANLKVNPRYGRVDRRGDITLIVPPEAPEVRREPAPAAPIAPAPVVPGQPTG